MQFSFQKNYRCCQKLYLKNFVLLWNDWFIIWNRLCPLFGKIGCINYTHQNQVEAKFPCVTLCSEQSEAKHIHYRFTIWIYDPSMFVLMGMYRMHVCVEIATKPKSIYNTTTNYKPSFEWNFFFCLITWFVTKNVYSFREIKIYHSLPARAVIEMCKFSSSSILISHLVNICIFETHEKIPKKQ